MSETCLEDMSYATQGCLTWIQYTKARHIQLLVKQRVVETASEEHKRGLYLWAGKPEGTDLWLRAFWRHNLWFHAEVGKCLTSADSHFSVAH